jgi:adenylyltransferase/sulfurtransferase
MNVTEDRYIRQSLFEGIGPKGHHRISAARAVVVGCGAVGGVVAGCLARSGIGRLRIIDRDFVETQNLHRQRLFDEDDADRRLPKAIAAARRLGAVNSTVELEPIVRDLNPDNAVELLAGQSIILDGTDNFQTRFLLNDVALKLKIPWIYAGAVGSSVSVMPVLPGEGACLRCLMEEAPAPGSLPTCETAGVVNAAPGVAGCLESSLALRILTGDTSFGGRLVTGDVWETQFRRVNVPKRADCPACAEGELDYLNRSAGARTAALCGREAVQILPAREGNIPLEKLQKSLGPGCESHYNGYLLRIEADNLRLMLFPTGRAIAQGTSELPRAKAMYARFVST